jgi:hypothetical protein
MIDNPLSTPLGAADLKAIDAAVTALERQLVEIAKLSKEKRDAPNSGTPAQDAVTPLAVPEPTLAAMNAALDALEAQFDKMVRFSDEGRSRLVRLDEKSEAFCRATLADLERNRDQLPPDFDLDGALGALRAYDAVRPLNVRLRRLSALLGK